MYNVVPSAKTCPLCRTNIESAKVDHRLANIIEAHVESHPHKRRSAEDMAAMDLVDTITKVTAATAPTGERRRRHQVLISGAVLAMQVNGVAPHRGAHGAGVRQNRLVNFDTGRRARRARRHDDDDDDDDEDHSDDSEEEDDDDEDAGGAAAAVVAYGACGAARSARLHATSR